MKRVIIAASRSKKFTSTNVVGSIVRYLNNQLPRSAKIQSNPQYTEVDIYDCKFKKHKIKKLVMKCLEAEGYETYVPSSSNSSRFVVINQDELFITVDVEDYYDGTSIFVEYNNSNICFEDWYDKYSASKSVTSSDYDECWEELDFKQVEDSDGFYTDYVLYKKCDEELYVCIFGDKDLYTPDNSEPDYETESREDAYDWFYSYEGFAEE